MDDTEETLLAGSGSGSGDFDPDAEEEEEDRDIVFRAEEAPTAAPAPSTRAPEVVRTSAGSKAGGMSLTRALLQYLLPIVLVWFGGAITNLL